MMQTSFAEIHPSFPKIGESMTEAEFAAYVGRDQSTISRWLSDGVLTRGADAPTWLRELIDHLAGQAAGRRGNGPLDLVQERARLAREQADKTNFELRRLRGEFMSLPLVCEAITICNSLVKRQLLNLAHELKSLLPEIEAKRVAILDDQIRATLSTLGQLRLPAEFLGRLEAWQVEGKEIPSHEKRTAPKKQGSRSNKIRDRTGAA